MFPVRAVIALAGFIGPEARQLGPDGIAVAIVLYEPDAELRSDGFALQIEVVG